MLDRAETFLAKLDTSNAPPEMAIRLDKAFGGGGGSWHLMQASDDTAPAMKLADRLKVPRVPQPTLRAE